jgi:hypothetical protein
MAVSSSVFRVVRALLSRKILVLISVRGWVNSRAIVAGGTMW